MAIRKRPLKKGFSYEYAFRYMGKQYRKSGFNLSLFLHIKLIVKKTKNKNFVSIL